MMRHRTVWVITVVGLSLAAVACGGDDAPEASDEAATASTEVEAQAEEQASEAEAGTPAEASTARSEPEQRPEQRGRDGAPSDATESDEDDAPGASTPAVTDGALEEAAGRAEPRAGDAADGDGDPGGDGTPSCGLESEDSADPDISMPEPADGVREGAEAQPETDSIAEGPERDPAEAAFGIDLPDWLGAATEVQVRRGTVDRCTRLLLETGCTQCVSFGIRWWSPRKTPSWTVPFFAPVSDFRWGEAGQAILDCGYCVNHGESVAQPPNFYWSTDGGLTWAVLPLPEPGKWIWRLEWMESPGRWVASREPAVVEGRVIRPTGGPPQFVLLPELTVLDEPPSRPEPPPEDGVDAHGQTWTATTEDAPSSASRLLRDGALVMDFAPFRISSSLSLSPSGERLVFSLRCSDPSDSCEQLFPDDAWVVVVETGTGARTVLRVALAEFRPDVPPLESDPPEPPELDPYRWESDELLWGVVRWRSLATLRPVALHLEALNIDVYAEPGADSGLHYPIATMPDRTQPSRTERWLCLRRFSEPRADHERPCVEKRAELAYTGVSAVYPDGSRWLLIESADLPWWVPEEEWIAGLGD